MWWSGGGLEEKRMKRGRGGNREEGSILVHERN